MAEILELLEQQGKAFHEFKQANDARLKALEQKGSVDPLLEEKVNKANDAISELDAKMKELMKKALRPQFGNGNSDERPEQAEHKAAFGKFLRKGVEDGLRELETKAYNLTTAADGGYAIPVELDNQILSVIRNFSPMRQLCNVIQVGGATYKKLVNLGGSGSGWVDEDDARPATASSQFATITPYMGDLYANPAATQDMLDDVFFNAESFIADEIGIAFSLAEGSAFLSGDGSKKPKGVLNYTSVTTADASRTFGQLQHKVTAGAAAITGDELTDLIYLLKPGYRAGSVWQMNTATLGYIRKLKASGTGEYLWSPGLEAGQPSNLMGFPVYENNDMADIATGVVAVMFGNFRLGYTIVDRMGSRMLRDPYTNKPYVNFYTTKRVGGMLADSNAIKLLKQA